jgi:hypothetical protein
MNMSRFITLLFLFFTLLISSSVALASGEDSFIQGYGTAVLVREFGVSPASLHVEDGVGILNADHIKPEDLSEVISILMSIQGVDRVEIVGTESHETESVKASDSPVIDESGTREESQPEVADQKDVRHKYKRVFEPLMADPLWPRFAISYHFFTDNGDLNNLLSAVIGGTVPVYEDDHPFTGRWQVAVQAAVFSINDVDTASWDLLNSDYRFGLGFMNQKGTVSGIFRIYHFSTHAGDEAILNSGAEREKISYEAVDTIFSYNPREWLRVYGGGAYRFSRHPKELDPWSCQYGLELTSSRQYLKILRPVAGANFNSTEENDWHTEISLRLGAEIESQETLWHKVQFLLGYFNGPSPYGQFFYQSHEYLDFGIHLYF